MQPLKPQEDYAHLIEENARLKELLRRAWHRFRNSLDESPLTTRAVTQKNAEPTQVAQAFTALVNSPWNQTTRWFAGSAATPL